MISDRTKLSLSQYLDLQPSRSLNVLFEKYGLNYYISHLEDIVFIVRKADLAQLRSLVEEILRTRGDLRTNVSPRYTYDERWDDFVHCLLLDGYRVEGRQLIPVDPTIEEAEPLDDDLTAALHGSSL